jgi:hypothetical protein
MCSNSLLSFPFNYMRKFQFLNLNVTSFLTFLADTDRESKNMLGEELICYLGKHVVYWPYSGIWVLPTVKDFMARHVQEISILFIHNFRDWCCHLVKN